MKLTAFRRTGKTKSETNRIRYEKDIPAVIYGPRRKSENIFIKGADFGSIIRKLPKGKLSTQVFDLSLDNQEHQAILKEIQYHRTSYDIIHVDFEVVEKDVPVNVNVPIKLTGVADCVGVKLGGTLRQVIRTLRVSCLPKDIPSEFTLDVKDLKILESLRLSDIKKPQDVRPLGNMKEVAVVVAKR